MATLINGKTKVVCLNNDAPPPFQFFVTCIHKYVIRARPYAL